MRLSRRICRLVLLLAACLGAIVGQAQISTEGKSLGEIARKLGAQTKAAGQSQATTSSAPQSPAQETAAVVTDPPEIERFIDDAGALLMREDFAELDKMADAARSSKARFPGGGWKLSRFYEALDKRHPEGFATDADWQSYLAIFQRWMAARPQSITARVSLAQAYLSYAWAARGTGYANTVPAEGWRLFEERSKQATKVLIDAAALPSKCPHWYAVMQRVALAEGASKDQQQAIFEKAIQFEPLYFAYYQFHATALLPKWGGETGDLKAFAEESYRRVGGKQGAHIYFEIASNLCGNCGDFSTDEFSWQKLQEGFAALEELYGLSQLKLNRFAFLASMYGDKNVAAKALARIGPNWDFQVWGTRARFEAQRSWAGLPASPPPPSPQVSKRTIPPLPNARVAEMLELAHKAQNEGRWNDSTQMAEQVIKTAESLPGTGTELGQGYLIIAFNESQQGHITKGQAMLDQAISAVSKKAGPDSNELALTLAQAGTYAQGMNDAVRAEADLRRAIEIREKTNGTSDPELSNDLTILGGMFRLRGRYKDAEELFERAINVRGRDDPFTISPLDQLGTMYQIMGRNQEAESTLLRELKVMEGLSGLNSPALVGPISKLADLYHVMGKAADEQRTRERLQLIQTKASK